MIRKLSVLASYAEDNFSPLRSGWKSGQPEVDKVLNFIYAELPEPYYIRTSTPEFWEILCENTEYSAFRKLLKQQPLLFQKNLNVSQNPFGNKQGVLISIGK